MIVIFLNRIGLSNVWKLRKVFHINLTIHIKGSFSQVALLRLSKAHLVIFFDSSFFFFVRYKRQERVREREKKFASEDHPMGKNNLINNNNNNISCVTLDDADSGASVTASSIC